MRFRASIKLIKIVMQTKTLPSHLILNATRCTFHPLERHLLNGWSFAPRSISVMITDRCNLHCRMCQYSNSESPTYGLNRAGYMSFDLFRHILDTCPGKPLIGLTGGEPLIHPQVLDFIRELIQRGFLCALTTNGSLLQAQAMELGKSQLDLLAVSIDGDEQTHDQIRSLGSFRKAVSGIQEVLRQPDRPIVAISTVITDINYRKLGESLSLAEELGVDILNINHLWIHTDQMILTQQDQPNLPQTSRILWRINIQDIDSDYVYESLHSMHKSKHRVLVHEYPQLNREETRTYYQQPEQLVKGSSSRCAWQVMRIYPDGEVGFCREYHAGNVKNQSLREIWNNQRYRNFRRYLRENGTCPICSRCCLVFSRI